jgi:hypothetical protein
MNWKRSGRKPSFSNCGTVHKFTGVTEETHENFNQDRRCTGRTSKRTPPEYKSRALPLGQPALCFGTYYISR